MVVQVLLKQSNRLASNEVPSLCEQTNLQNNDGSYLKKQK